MTRDEFLERYHAYRTTDPVAAAREAATVQIPGDTVVVVRFRDEYCLMLMQAVRLLVLMGEGDETMEVYDPRRILEGADH